MSERARGKKTADLVERMNGARLRMLAAIKALDDYKERAEPRKANVHLNRKLAAELTTATGEYFALVDQFLKKNRSRRKPKPPAPAPPETLPTTA